MMYDASKNTLISNENKLATLYAIWSSFLFSSRPRAPVYFKEQQGNKWSDPNIKKIININPNPIFVLVHYGVGVR